MKEEIPLNSRDTVLNSKDGVLTPPKGVTSSFRVYLCHRRAPNLSRAEFQKLWLETHAPMVREYAGALGCTRYVQLRMTEHPDPLGASIAASRSWLAISIVSLFSGKRPPGHEKDILNHAQREFDVVDELWFSSEEALIEAMGTEKGAQALAAITADGSEHLSTTSVVAGAGYEFLEKPASYPSLKVMFCLRRKRDMSRHAMQEYWLTSHGPFAQTLKPQLQFRGYEQVHTLEETALGSFAGAFGNSDPSASYDGMASLRYSTERELGEHFLHPGFQAANMKLAKDELNFVDGQECIVVFGYQKLIFDQPG